VRTTLLCAFVLGASAFSVPALAQDTETMIVQSEVPAYCSQLSVEATPMNLGNLTGPAGQVVTDFSGAPESTRELSASFYCNAPSTVTIQADPLLNETVSVIGETDAFTNRVDYTAALQWRDLLGSVSSTVPAGEQINAPEANIGSLTLVLSNPVVSNNLRPVAGDYSGEVHLTISLTQ
jgi:hypothetical protein